MSVNVENTIFQNRISHIGRFSGVNPANVVNVSVCIQNRVKSEEMKIGTYRKHSPHSPHSHKRAGGDKKNMRRGHETISKICLHVHITAVGRCKNKNKINELRLFCRGFTQSPLYRRAFFQSLGPLPFSPRGSSWRRTLSILNLPSPCTPACGSSKHPIFATDSFLMRTPCERIGRKS